MILSLIFCMTFSTTTIQYTPIMPQSPVAISTPTPRVPTSHYYPVRLGLKNTSYKPITFKSGKRAFQTHNKIRLKYPMRTKTK